MTRYERTELDKALLNAARNLWLMGEDFEKLSFQDIHKALKDVMPVRLPVNQDWKDDFNAYYDAKERFIASGEYKVTGRTENIFLSGWNAAKDHYQGLKHQGRNPGDGQP
jgi:hypothetical protein